MTEERRVYLNKWEEHRTKTFNESVELFGKLNKDNLKQHQKHMKTAEKKWKAENK